MIMESFFESYENVKAIQNNRTFIQNEATHYIPGGEVKNVTIFYDLNEFIASLKNCQQDTYSNEDIEGILSFAPRTTIIDHGNWRKLLVALIFELFNSRNAVYNAKILDIDNENTNNHVLSNELFEINHMEMVVNEYVKEIHYNIVAKDQVNPPRIQPQSYVLIKNTHDEPSYRKNNSVRVILEEIRQIDFTYVYVNEEDQTITESGKLDISDNSAFNPTSLIDADYEDQYFFTIRNNSDFEGIIKSIAVKAIHQRPVEGLNPSSFRLPIINCTSCKPYIQNQKSNQYNVIGLKRATELAGALDLIGEPFILQPRGTHVTQLVNFFRYREYENSPNQFLLRSRFSRNGIMLEVRTETENDESLLTLTFSNMTDYIVNVPGRCIQYLPTPYVPLNASLVDCETSDHFLSLSKNKRKNKV